MSASSDRRAEWNDMRRRHGRSPVDPPPPPPHDPGMEARVARLEDDFKEARKDLKDIRDGIAGIRERLASLEGKIGNLPSTWVMVTTLAASQIALLGFTFAIIRFALPGK